MLLKSFKRRVPRTPALSFNLIILSANFSAELGGYGNENLGRGRHPLQLQSPIVILLMQRDRTYHCPFYFFLIDHYVVYLSRLCRFE